MSQKKAHILYVEDDESLSFVTRDNLLLQGFEVTHSNNGRQALDIARAQPFDLCILDVMLPEMDGFTLAQQIRSFNAEIPILFLTAKSLKEDKIHGLRIGADDYLTKPFSIEELLLKIEIFLRRRNISQPAQSSRLRCGRFTFDHHNLTLLLDGQNPRSLTQKEADLLHYLLRHRNQVLKRATILEQLWGEDDYFLGRSLDVFISRLRKYLQPDPEVKIENIHAVGFRLKCPD